MTAPSEATELAKSVAGEMTAGAYLTVLRVIELARLEGAAAERERIRQLAAEHDKDCFDRQACCVPAVLDELP